MDLIDKFEPREYQKAIFNTCLHNNTLVVLPTGMGKTAISLMLASARLKMYPNSKFVMLAPSKPLVMQHLETFKELLEGYSDKELVVFTGEISPAQRKKLWENATIIFSTPQGFANDIANGNLNLDKVSCLVLDEAHKAVGNYDYVWISKQYYKLSKYPRIVGLTASPGSKIEDIKDVCKNLFIEEIEVRSREDPDVLPYVQETNVKIIKIKLPDNMKIIRAHLRSALKESLQHLKEFGFLRSAEASRGDLLMVQKELQRRIGRGERSHEIWQSATYVAQGIKLQHAIGLLETQGVGPLKLYFDKLMHEAEHQKTKATKNIVINPEFKAASYKTNRLYEEGIEHPKFEKIKEIISQKIKSDEKIIIFTQYRSSALKIVETVSQLKDVKAKLFVGQAKKLGTGLSQKEQLNMLSQFSKGEFNVLVATSVAEEGLDVPAVSLVLFFEPVPSAIRQIQRRGRTGRLEKGEVVILMTEGTIDEAYRWSSYHKERRMYRTLKELKNKIKLESQAKLKDYVAEKLPKIIVDSREPTAVKSSLKDSVDIEIKNLAFADFVINDIGIERKTTNDLINSIIDKRLLSQVKGLKQVYNRRLLIVEGQDLYEIRQIHPNSIRGMLASVALDFACPIIFTRNLDETIEFLKVIAKREFANGFRSFNPQTSKKPSSVKEMQEYIVSSLPHVGPRLAKSLLEEFKNVKNIINAETDELAKLDKVSKNAAEDIKKVIEEPYSD